MRILFLFLFLPFSSLWSQTLEDLDFGTDQTLDIVTWNIEWFPKNDITTLQYVVEIIEAMDADIIAIQEVDDYFFFNDLVAFLEDYDGYSQSSNNRGLAYIYKSDIISINNAYELFLAPPESYNFPRYPMVLDINYYQEQVVLINNHYKCCGDGDLDLNDSTDEETRRYNANLLLKDYMDTALNNVPVVLLGDLNDVLTDAPQDNVFQNFLEDPDEYLFVDIEIANGPTSNFSYPSWPSHIDHILINKALFVPFNADGGGVETIRVDDYLAGGFNEYDQNVSDHRPVGMRVVLPQVLSTSEIVLQQDISVFPNPASSEVTVSIQGNERIASIQVYDYIGKLVQSHYTSTPEDSINFNIDALPSGIYVLEIAVDDVAITYTRLVIQ